MLANKYTKQNSQNVVPKLNLQNLGKNFPRKDNILFYNSNIGSRSAPNSARSSTLSGKETMKKGRSTSKLSETDKKYLAWKKRKDYKPTITRYSCFSLPF